MQKQNSSEALWSASTVLMQKRMLAIIALTGALFLGQAWLAHASDFLYWGKKGYNATDPDTQIKYFTKALDKWENSDGYKNRAITYYNRGSAYTNLGEYVLAIRDYTEAIKINPTDPSYYYNRGLAYNNEREYDLALRDYDEAVRLNPLSAEIYGRLKFPYAKHSALKAAQRSFVLPGWGQFYNKQPTKGIFIATVEGLLVGAAIANYCLSNSAYDRYMNATYLPDIVGYYEKANGYHWYSNYLTLFALGVWAYNVIDAYIVRKYICLEGEEEKTKGESRGH